MKDGEYGDPLILQDGFTSVPLTLQLNVALPPSATLTSLGSSIKAIGKSNLSSYYHCGV